jgi:predicted RNA-binding Zn-ribbon protein involved in translation (DUF1610 family)
MTVRILHGDCRQEAPRALREVASCRGCGWAWRPATGRNNEPCPHCGKNKDVRLRPSAPRNLAGLQAWRDRNPKHSTKASRLSRHSALLLIGCGRIACVRCGCDREALIEINHKEGGGAQELKKGGSQQFYRDIALLRRPVDDLELLCKPCNAVHALELLHGPLPFRVVWGSE